MTNLVVFRETHRNGVMIFMLILFVALYAPSMMFKYIWMDLRSVTVGSDLSVIVDRRINMDFTGSYSVILRRALDERIICSGQSSEPELIPYNTDANKTNPVPYSLPEWAGWNETWQAELCAARGLNTEDHFYIITCHEAWLAHRFKIARRCVSSNVFTPTPDAVRKFRQMIVAART